MQTKVVPAAPDRREFFAAERTLLAYVRTGVAMMGIGFVVARFSLMLRMLPQTAASSVHHESSTHSLWLGTALVLAGTAVMLLSALQYIRQVKALNVIYHLPSPTSWLAIGLSVGAACFGVVMAIYLVTSTNVPT